jgi:hypothetical protein
LAVTETDSTPPSRYRTKWDCSNFLHLQDTAKLDRETEELKRTHDIHVGMRSRLIDDTVPLEVGKAIMQARMAKGWKQKELATVYFFSHQSVFFSSKMVSLGNNIFTFSRKSTSVSKLSGSTSGLRPSPTSRFWASWSVLLVPCLQ